MRSPRKKKEWRSEDRALGAGIFIGQREAKEATRETGALPLQPPELGLRGEGTLGSNMPYPRFPAGPSTCLALSAGLFFPLVVTIGNAPNGAREPGHFSGFLLGGFTHSFRRQILLSTY